MTVPGSTLSSLSTGAISVAPLESPPPEFVELPPIFDVNDPNNAWRLLKPANDNMPLPWWLAAAKIAQEFVKGAAGVASIETGVVVLFGAPIGCAAAEYLQHPEKYPGGPRPQCGETDPPSTGSGRTGRRPFEWRPLVKPLMSPHSDYRNPKLSETERQKLVEWLQTEKTRGSFTGAEGLPNALPQDPPHDDSYGVPAEFRNGVMNVPRPNAMPMTEVTLPDLQQSDDQRRMMMGDAVPGRERVIGDRLQEGAPHHGARDFLTPQSELDASPREKQDHLSTGVPPDIQMMEGDYSRLYRRNNSNPVPAKTSTPHMAPAEKRADAKDCPRILVPFNPPDMKELGEIEDVFRYLATLCPVDDRGIMDTSVLRIGHDLTKGVEFQGGNITSVQRLLKNHEDALRIWSEQQGKKPPQLEGGPRSEMRLMDVLRRVTGRKYLLSTRQAPIAKAIVKTDLQNLNFDKPNKELANALRQAWENFELTHGKMTIHAMQATMLEAKSGNRVRMQDLMSLYWKGLRADLAKKNFVLPDTPNYYATEDALDLIYFNLFGRVRIRSHWVGSLQAVTLPLSPNEPLPEVATLKGALSVLYKLSQTSVMDGVDRFPVEPKGSLVVVYDPRTGRSFNYEKLMYAVYEMLARAKADVQTAPVFTEIVVPDDVMRNPESAFRRFPNKETRQSLLEFVRKHQGYPETRSTKHLRIPRGGVAEVRTMVTLSPDATGGFPRVATATQPYLQGDVQLQFPTVMFERFKTRLFYATSILDAAEICDDMVQRGLTDATGVKTWLEKVSREKSDGIQSDLKHLTNSRELAPIVIPLLLNDVYSRLQALLSLPSRTERRWKAYWKSEEMDVLGTLPRFDRIRTFVLDEEARLDALPKRGMFSALGPRSTEDPRMPEPWQDVHVPKAFADAMSPLLTSPGIRARANDLSRAFMQLMPLDDIGLVQWNIGEGPASTQDVVYNLITGRPPETWNEAALTPKQRSLRDKMIKIGEEFGMIQFNDYWLGQGVKIASRSGAIPPTLRIYLAINPDWAADALRALNEIYAGWKPNEPRDVQFKMTNVPTELMRTDASLYYVDAANQGIFDRIVALQERHPEYLRAIPGPPTTAQFLSKGQSTGISVAEAPRNVRDSRNGVMSQLVTKALQLYRERLMRGQQITQAEWIQIAAYYMAQEGIDLERPGFYSGNANRQPGWVIFAGIFRRTDQYNPERDDPLLHAALTKAVGSVRTPTAGVSRFADVQSVINEFPWMRGAGWAEDPFAPSADRAVPFSKSQPGPLHRASDGDDAPPPGPVERSPRKEASGLRQSHVPGETPLHSPPDAPSKRAVSHPVKGMRQSRPDPNTLPQEIRAALLHPGILAGETEDDFPIGQMIPVDDAQVWRVNRHVLFVEGKLPGSHDEGVSIHLFFKAGEIPGYPKLSGSVSLENLRRLVAMRVRLPIVVMRSRSDDAYPLIIQPEFTRVNRREQVTLNVMWPERPGVLTTIPWHADWETKSPMDTIRAIQGIAAVPENVQRPPTRRSLLASDESQSSPPLVEAFQGWVAQSPPKTPQEFVAGAYAMDDALGFLAESVLGGIHFSMTTERLGRDSLTSSLTKWLHAKPSATTVTDTASHYLIKAFVPWVETFAVDHHWPLRLDSRINHALFMYWRSQMKETTDAVEPCQDAGGTLDEEFLKRLALADPVFVAVARMLQYNASEPDAVLPPEEDVVRDVFGGETPVPATVLKHYYELLVKQPDVVFKLKRRPVLVRAPDLKIAEERLMSLNRFMRHGKIPTAREWLTWVDSKDPWNTIHPVFKILAHALIEAPGRYRPSDSELSVVLRRNGFALVNSNGSMIKLWMDALHVVIQGLDGAVVRGMDPNRPFMPPGVRWKPGVKKP